jgi:hypothetical protein
MGKLTDDELEKLFQDHLLGFEKEPSKEVWPLLAKDVARNNFLKFGWKHFNIYQTVVLTLILLLGIIYFTQKTEQTISSEQKKTSLPQTFPVTIDSLSKIEKGKKTDTKNTNQNELLKIESNNRPIKSTKDKSTFLKEQKSEVRKEKGNLTDSSSVIYEPSNTEQPQEIINTETKKKEEIPKIKKIITVIRRDTILVKDTVSVKRKKKVK